ncbi:MAG: class II fructose-bisphosphate aldolase [bacterium]
MAKTLKEYILEAEEKGIAVGHFNISNLEGVKAIVEAVSELKVPVIIGVSEGERNFVGVEEISAIVKAEKEKTGLPIFLNADHTHSFESAKKSIDKGFDSITVDGSKLSLDENVKYVKSCVEYVVSKEKNVVIECELGYIGTSSEVHTEVPTDIAFDENSLTHPDDAAKLVRESGAFMLAPAVGNMHGMIGVGKDPKLNIKRIEEIRNATGVPLVLHGASGNSDEDVRSAIKAGCAVVHVNTELRVAFREGLESGLEENPDEVAAYKYEVSAVEQMKKVVIDKLKLFNNL